MPKLIRRAIIVLSALLLAAAVTAYFWSRHWLRRTLEEGIAAGPGMLRVVGADVDWNFRFRADSLQYLAPSLEVVSGPLAGEAELFASFFRIAPSLVLEADSVAVDVTSEAEPTAAPEAAPKGPPAFPNLRIPAVIRFSADLLSFHRDSVRLARIAGLRLNSPGGRFLELEADGIRFEAAPDVTPSLRAKLAWNTPDSLLLRAEIRRGPDSLNMQASLLQSDLRQGGLSARAYLSSSQPYAALLERGPPLPLAEKLRLAMDARLDPRPAMEAEIEVRLSGFDSTAAYAPGPQQLQARLLLNGEDGRLSLRSRGDRGERIELSGDLDFAPLSGLQDLGSLAGAALEVRGSINGVPLRLGGEERHADLRILPSRLGRDAVRLEVITGESSRLKAELDRGPKGWAGSFSGDIAPDERWLRIFVDTNIGFAGLRVNGRVDGNTLVFASEARDVRAYGARADSLRARHRFRPGTYELLGATLFRREAAWSVNGRVLTGGPGFSLAFHAKSPRFGALSYRMPAPGSMEVEANELVLEKLPYPPLQNLPLKDLGLTGRFAWNMRAQEGLADVTARGIYRNLSVSGSLKGAWNADSLSVSEATLRQDGSTLRAAGDLRLAGRRFYQLAGLGLEDCLRLRLSAEHFEIPRVLEMFLEEGKNPLAGGRLEGSMDYLAHQGFAGEMRVEELAPHGLRERVDFERLALSGMGDSLVLVARTFSEREPLLRDSLRVAVTGVLAEEQSLSARLRVGRDLRAAFSGRSQRFRDLQGELRVEGQVRLPGNSGHVRDLQAKAMVDIPFRRTLERMRVRVEELRGTYAIPGLDTQYFDARLDLHAGEARLSSLRIRNARGQELTGTGSYRLSGGGGLELGLSGESFAAAWQEAGRFQLRDIRVRVRMDSLGLFVRAGLGQARVQAARPPLSVGARLRDVALEYRAPKAAPFVPEGARAPLGGASPSLDLRATLDSSLVRYRLKSFDALQSLFRRREKSRPSRPEGAPDRPLELNVEVETDGLDNRIDTQILRMNMVGNLGMQGVWPYALVQGRLSAAGGEIGLERQAYAISQLEVKWLNAPLEEGRVEMEAQKRLATSCAGDIQDSCQVTTLLTGALKEMEFSYRTDCGGSPDAAADIGALILSVRRGCYDARLRAGEGGASLGDRALALLEAPVSEKLSEVVERYSQKWIAHTEVAGLGALMQEPGDSARALSVEIVSREFLRTRLRARAGYKPGGDVQSPWEQMVGLEWRPPLADYVRNPGLKRRLKDNLRLVASMERDPSLEDNPNEDVIRQKVSLDYGFEFWRLWFAR